jgi:hypothetical protein
VSRIRGWDLGKALYCMATALRKDAFHLGDMA